MPENIFEYLKKFVHPVIFGSLFISLCASGLFLETYLLLDQRLKPDGLLFLVFFATLALYNLHRLLSYMYIKKEDYGLVTAWTARNWFSVLMFALIGTGGVAFFIFQMSLEIVAVLVLLGVLSFLYEFPIIRFRRYFHRLRNLWMFKIIMITVAWSVATALLPAMQAGISLTDYQVWLTFFERMLFVFLIAVCFDARDMEYDRKEGLSTIPIRFGMPFTLKLYSIICILFILVSVVHYMMLNHRIGTGLAMILSGGITYLIISRTYPRRSDYYYLFAVDGMLLLQFVLVALFTWIWP